MAHLDDLSSYQAKVLRTATAIVEVDGAIASASDMAQRERLTRHVDSLRAMLRAYEGMVSFLNCCIEIDRRTASSKNDAVNAAKQA